MWQKVKAFCLHSATIATTYVIAIVGGLLSLLDGLGIVFGDPNFKDQVSQFLANRPELLGWVMMAISVVVFIARLRSILSQHLGDRHD